MKCNSSVVFEMKLANAPFEKIMSGKKDIEMRLLDDKRSQIQVGDVVIFQNNDDGREVVAEVIGLHLFPTFQEMYKAIYKTRLGYEEGETANHEDMLRYYTLEKQRAFGVVGIELKVMV